MAVKYIGLRSRQTQDLIEFESSLDLILPFTGHVTLGILLNLSEPHL